jgi:hypothetical protein
MRLLAMQEVRQAHQEQGLLRLQQAFGQVHLRSEEVTAAPRPEDGRIARP